MGSLLAPLGSLLAPFSSLLAPFDALLAPLGSLLALLAPFGSLLVSLGSLLLSPGHFFRIFMYFRQKCRAKSYFYIISTRLSIFILFCNLSPFVHSPPWAQGRNYCRRQPRSTFGKGRENGAPGGSFLGHFPSKIDEKNYANIDAEKT